MCSSDLRECQQPLDDLIASRGQRDAILGQLERHHQQCDVLGGVGLISAVSYPRIETVKQRPEATYFGRGDTNFGASVDVNTTVRFTRDGRTDGIDNTHAERATFQTVPHRQDRVSSLSALTDDHANVITENRGLPVQEVGRKLDADRYLCQLLEDSSSGQARVVAGAARREYNPTTAADDREVCPETTKSDEIGRASCRERVSSPV